MLLGVVELVPLVPVDPDVPEVLELGDDVDDVDGVVEEVVLPVVPAPDPEEVVVSLVSVLPRVPGSREQPVRPSVSAASAEMAVIFSGLLFIGLPLKGFGFSGGRPCHWFPAPAALYKGHVLTSGDRRRILRPFGAATCHGGW